MNGFGGGASRMAAGRTVFAAVVVLVLAGCSGDGEPTPKSTSGATSGSSSSGGSPAALKDESAAILGWTPPAPVAKTKGRLELFTKGEWVPAVAEIISVQASDASTILTWQLSSTQDIPLQGRSLSSFQSGDYPDTVRLIDLAGKKSYEVNKMRVDKTGYCVCSAHPIHVGPDPVRMTAEYPALPATATTISVRIPNFPPLTVPLTR